MGVNDTSCELVDPLPTVVQDLVDYGMITPDSLLDGCVESSLVTMSTTGSTTDSIVGSPTGAPSADVTEQPTSDASTIGVAIGWIFLMILFF